MGTVTARARPSRQIMTPVHYFCGGDGCRSRHVLAIFYPAQGRPGRGQLYAGEDFKEVDGTYTRVKDSGRPKGRHLKWDYRARALTNINGLPYVSPEKQRVQWREMAAIERPARRSRPVWLYDAWNDHLFRCPDRKCKAINVIPAPVDKALAALDRARWRLR